MTRGPPRSTPFPNTTLFRSHTYADEITGSEPISVSISDAGGSITTITGSATVADAALTGSSAPSGTPTTSSPGQPTCASFNDANPCDPTAHFPAHIPLGHGR